MMLTDEQSKWLAEQVYWLEQEREDVRYSPFEGSQYPFDPTIPSHGQFQVLQVEDNHANGMQAMAVSPVVNVVADYNYITIAYAGTNFGD
ncbi:hypothetical protein MKL26_00260 [Streptococcus suis]|nr:hypothetical protein [Streptococcus suis]